MGEVLSERRDTIERWSVHTTVLVVTLAAVLFGCYVWPTPWQYLSHQFLATRVHRATGHAQVLTADGWRAVKVDYVDETSEQVLRERLRIQVLARQMHHDEMMERREARQGGTAPGRQRRQGEGGGQALAPDVVAPVKLEGDEYGPGRTQP